MKRVFFIAIVLSLFVGGLASQSLVRLKLNDKLTKVPGDVVPKTLVVYFSYSGQTEYVAQRLALYTGADLCRIETAEPYPKDNDLLVARAKKELESKEPIKLVDNNLKLKEYDVVFIGSPVWCGQWNMAALQFAADKRLEGKIVIPFLTAGRDNEQLLNNIVKYAINAKIMRGFCVFGDQLKKEKEVDDIILNCLKRNNLIMAERFGEALFTDMAVLKSVKIMQTKYPKITLCDIYKSYYQDAFGPGHMILSKTEAKKAIKKELNMSSGATVGYEPTGALGRYTRVDLAYIKEKKIKIDDYLDLVMSGVTDNTGKDMKEWEREWNFVMSVIERYGVKIDGYNDDKKVIMDMWNEGKYVMHHSRIFNEQYNPHYRLVPTSAVKYLR
ncbi:MAG: hypothetical protein MJZ93_02895 [Paludibacteraceae bacterium]|nr:hypothetical protein [Paludibacteraceae bacterium]